MAPERPFRFGVAANATPTAAAWRDLARRVEGDGFTSLTVSDHFGEQFALVPAMTVALEATARLRVGALVACNDFRLPVMFAKELATMDLFSDGRVEWGMGAGWLKPEYDRAGLAFDPPGQRVSRLIEAVAVMRALFRDGAATFEGSYYRLDAMVGGPPPPSGGPPLLIGAAGPRLLAFAGREADAVGVAPSWSTVQLGGRPPRQTPLAATDDQIDVVRAAAGDRWPEIEVHAVVLPAGVGVARRGEQALRLAERAGRTVDDVHGDPHVWLGSVDEVCAALEERRERWGFSSYAVPAAAMAAVAPVVDRLTGR